MNYFDFKLPGGFPLETDVFDELQTAYTIFNNLGYSIGNYTIVKGCEVQGQNVTDGVVFLNGELIPFKGGLIQTHVVLKENEVRKPFQNGTQPVYLKKRFLCFGTGVNAIAWSNFKRPKTTLQLTEDQEDKEDKATVAQLMQRVKTLEENQSNIPIGLVSIWGRSLDSIPNGWREYTPLSGKMPIGLTAGDTDLDLIGKSGGAKEKVLQVSNLPEHKHSKTDDFNLFAGLATNISNSGTDGLNDLKNEDQIAIGNLSASVISEMQEQEVGENKAFNIMNPYRVVMFIEYIGLNNN